MSLRWMCISPGQCSITSSRPSLVTTIGHPARRLRIHSLYCRDKQPTLYSVPAGAAYKDIFGALVGHYGYLQLAASFLSQLKAGQVIARVCTIHQVVGPPASCQFTCGLHPEGCRPYIRRRTETPRTDHGRRQVTHPGP